MIYGLLQLLAAWFLPSLDCDEIFNYWEPLHYLQYGTGSQVWEYSSDYALRSYFYLYLHYLPSIFYLSSPKVLVFKLTRVIIALFSVFCQEKLRRSLELPRVYFFIFSISPGILLAGHTFVPSAFAMNCIMLGYSYFVEFQKKQTKSLLFSALLSCSFAMVAGWPFISAMLAAFVLPYLMKHSNYLFNTTLYTLGIIALIVTVAPSYFLDTIYYKKHVLSVLNVIFYNISFGKNIVGSSIIFGIEPWHMYLNNLFLNFNLVTFT